MTSIVKFRTLVSKLKTWWIPGLLLMLSTTISAAEIDIRTAVPLDSYDDEIHYRTSIDDCRELVSIKAGTDAQMAAFTPMEASHSSASSTGCEIGFVAKGSDRFNPTVRIQYLNGTAHNHHETYQLENIAPQINLAGVAIAEEGGRQFLTAAITAEDDTDISHITAELIGLRASDLRAAGGVIELAAKNAYARAEKTLYPSADNTNSYSARVELSQQLSADELMHDALVLVELTAVDASGNQKSLSRIVFTGEDVEEKINGFSVLPSSLTFTNLLETSQLIPVIHYQFRGQTPAPGRGQGISYTSSDPQSVFVSDDGVVYPLRETAQPVTVTVSLAGQTPEEIPVTVDLNKNLIGLSLEGIGENHPFTLSSLNQFYELPTIKGILRDKQSGALTTVPLNTSHKIQFTIASGADAFMSVRNRTVKSSVKIDSNHPVMGRVSLSSSSDIAVDFPIVAVDAPPSVTLQIGGSAVVGEILKISATPRDDAGISAVELWLDGAVINRWTAPPFELGFPLPPEFLGKALSFKAVAIDSAGQASQPVERQIKVAQKPEVNVPPYTFVHPVEGARLIARTPFVMHLEASLGFASEMVFSSGITGVDFFIDGQKIASALIPVIEERENGDGEKVLWEIWRTTAAAPDISLDDTAFAISARVRARQGKEDSSARLVRVVQNRAPQVRMLSPSDGTDVTVGQSVNIRAEAADDTLNLGTTLELLVNDSVVQSLRHGENNAISGDQVGMEFSHEAKDYICITCSRFFILYGCSG